MFEPFTLDQLTVFLAVVDHGSFSAAGQELGRVQSAVSHAVATLEDTLGTRLFDRRGRRPVPTASGLRLAAEARLVLAQARELRHRAAALVEGLEPTVAMVVDPLYPRAALIEACRDFHRAFPEAELRIRHEVLARAVALVHEGLVDLGVCNLAEASPEELVSVPVGRVQLVPVCAPDHPLAATPAPQRTDQLRGYTQVVLSEREVRTADLGVLAPRTWRVTDLDTKVDLLLAGIGWGSVPLLQVETWLADGRLVRLYPEQWLGGGHDVLLHVVVRADHPLGPAGSWLRERMVL
jgi:DNA-binding transcriptional LysR family regulator